MKSTFDLKPNWQKCIVTNIFFWMELELELEGKRRKASWC